MTQLTKYEDFINRVDELGFMPLSDILPGFPSLSNQTPENLWHTGLDTDPWQWKDRAASEKRLAYGCILGGKKGFISARMYPLFFSAYHPAEPMPDRWAAGNIPQLTWKLWGMIEEKSTLNTSQARSLLGVNKGIRVGQVDKALNELQMEFYLTVSGNIKKVSIDGRLYGWPSNQYTRVLDWVPADWLVTSMNWQKDEARESIIDAVAGSNKSLNREKITKALHL
jgi:hypothetical protein